MVKILAVLLGIAILGLLGHTIYDMVEGPAAIKTEDGTVRATSARHPGKVITARTRRMRRGDDTYWEVELPGANWVACAADCAETFRTQHLDLIDTIEESGR